MYNVYIIPILRNKKMLMGIGLALSEHDPRNETNF